MGHYYLSCEIIISVRFFCEIGFSFLPTASSVCDLIAGSHTFCYRVDEILQSDTFTDISEQIEQYKANHASSKTSQLWFQYIKAIEIFLRFLEGERTSNWKLHLQVSREMISYFFASGTIYMQSQHTYIYRQWHIYPLPIRKCTVVLNKAIMQ